MDLMEEEASRDEKSMHPSIREWKEQIEDEDEEYDLVDLEEGNYSANDNNTASATPISMEEIEENRRQRRLRRKYSRIRHICFVVVLLFIMYQLRRNILLHTSHG